MSSVTRVTTAQVFAIAGPAMVANMTTPLIGIVSTIAIGRRPFGNAGLWGALLAHYAARGGLQALRYPAMLRASFPRAPKPV